MKTVKKQGGLFIIVRGAQDQAAQEARNAHQEDCQALAAGGVSFDTLVAIVLHFAQRLAAVERKR